jgi:zinc transport system permease protein
VSEFVSAISDYRFMQLALMACLLASIGCGVIGSYVVVKRIGFLAGGIAHSVLAGMGAAYFLGGAPVTGAVIAALTAAVLVGWVNLKWKQDEDVLIAALWSMGMATGIIFISRTPGYAPDLMSYLFGNILLVTANDLILMAILDLIILVLVAVFYKQLLATVFDEEFARLRGVNVELFYILLLCIIALTVVLLMRIVGLILVIALLILPAAAAGQVSRSLLQMMWLAVLLSVGITVAGLALSYGPNLPSGSTMVLVAGATYLLSLWLRVLYVRTRQRPRAQ